MAISSKDIETLWGRYQSDEVSKGVVRSLGENPEDGTAYVFMSKDQKLVKIIHYEDGLLQYYSQKFKGGFSFVRLRFDGGKRSVKAVFSA